LKVVRWDKSYQRRGCQAQLGDQKAELDSFAVFAGAKMAPLDPGSPLEEQMEQARAAYQRSQRAYREQRNASEVPLISAAMAHSAPIASPLLVRHKSERRRCVVSRDCADRAPFQFR
jgi:hypothetical protein